MSRSLLVGCFAVVVSLSGVASGQAEGEAPGTNPAAPPAAAPAANPEGAAPAAPRAVAPRTVVKRSEAPKTVPPKLPQPPQAAVAPAPQVGQADSDQAVPPPPAPGGPHDPADAHHGHDHAAPGHVPTDAHQDHGAERQPTSAHDSHAGSDHAAASSGHAHESPDPPYLDDVNWFYGLLGENDEVEPNLLYRPTGMPIPFLATLINWGILIALIGMLAKKQLPAALAKRKATIVQGMQEAKKLRDESAERLREYEDKLAKIGSDIERIKAEMQQAGEQERSRILAEAVERRTRMERDARRLIETELEAIKDTLRREVVQVALSAAKQSIESAVTAADQQRLFDEAMSSLKTLPPRSLGGQA